MVCESCRWLVRASISITAPDDEPITPVSTPSPSNDSEPPKKPRVRLTLAQKLCIHSEILQVHNQRFTQKFTQKMQENVGRTRFGPKKPRIIEVRVQSRRVKSRDDCTMVYPLLVATSTFATSTESSMSTIFSDLAACLSI